MEDGFWVERVTLRDMPLSGIPQDYSSLFNRKAQVILTMLSRSFSEAKGDRQETVISKGGGCHEKKLRHYLKTIGGPLSGSSARELHLVAESAVPPPPMFRRMWRIPF